MLSITPSFELIGEILEFDFKEPSEEQPKPSALMCVRYGPEREWRNDVEVNFVNEIYVKIPFGKYSKIIEKFQEGLMIRIKGRLQCSQKQGDDSPRVELNAEQILFLVEA